MRFVAIAQSPYGAQPLSIEVLMSTGHVSLPLPRMSSAPSKDPFGSLFSTAASAGSAPAPAPAPAPIAVQAIPPAMPPPAVADDDWGDSDFTEAPMPSPAPTNSGLASPMLSIQPSPITVPSTTDDDWGDSDFSAATPALTVNNQVGVKTSGLDDWGDSDFASAPSAVVEPPDSLLGGDLMPTQATSARMPLDDGSDDLMGSPDRMMSTPATPTEPETIVAASEVKTDLIASLIASNLGSVSSKAPVTSAPSLIELQKQKELTNTAGDSFDDWKPPSQAVMMASEVSATNKMAAIDALAEIDLAAETEEWDDFAEGTESVAVAAPTQVAPESSEDDWGDGFVSAAPTPQPTVEFDAEISKQAESTEFGGIESSGTRADNPFEDFDDDFKNADPAPFDSAASGTTESQPRTSSPFGQFDDDSNPATSTATTVPAVSASAKADEDDWGDDTDFKSVETSNKPDDPFEGVDGSSNNNTELASESVIFASPHDVSASGPDLSSDLSSGADCKTTETVTETKPTTSNDPFADIDGAPEESFPTLSAPALALDNNADDDDWGNAFSSAPPPVAGDQAAGFGSGFKRNFEEVKPDSNLEVKDATSVSKGDDDWGSGDLFATAAASSSLSTENDKVELHKGTESSNSLQDVTALNASEDDDDWGGEFASAPGFTSFGKNLDEVPVEPLNTAPPSGNSKLDASDNFAALSAPSASYEDPFGDFNDTAVAVEGEHGKVVDSVDDEEAESCALPELLEKLLSCELLNEALQCMRHMELESELKQLKAEKAEAAADDRFEDAAAYRDKINTAAGKLAPEPAILKWRSAAKHRPSESIFERMCAEMDETSAQRFRQTFCSVDSLVTHARRDLAGAAERLRRAKRCAALSRATRSSHQSQGAAWEQSLSVVSVHVALLEESIAQSDLVGELVKVPAWDTFVRGVAEMIGVAARVLASAQDAFWEPRSSTQIRTSQDLANIAGRIATSLRAVKCSELADLIETRPEVAGLAPIDAPICALTWFPMNEEDELTVLVENVRCLATSGNFFVNCVQGRGGVSGLSDAPST